MSAPLTAREEAMAHGVFQVTSRLRNLHTGMAASGDRERIREVTHELYSVMAEAGIGEGAGHEPFLFTHRAAS